MIPFSSPPTIVEDFEPDIFNGPSPHYWTVFCLAIGEDLKFVKTARDKFAENAINPSAANCRKLQRLTHAAPQ